MVSVIVASASSSNKNGRQYKTAAFVISCDAGSKDIFYDESIWPEVRELRDWIIFGKKTTDDSTDTKKSDNNGSDTHSCYGVKSFD